MRDGQKHGVWIELDHDFMCERTYVAGVLHGPSREWHPKGHLFEKVSYAAGKRDGLLERWHPDGARAIEAHYVGGKLHGIARTYDPSGVMTEREYRDDEMWNGIVESEGEVRGRYVDGKKVGPWRDWHYNKRLKERGTYVEGTRHGEFELCEDLDRGESWRGSFDMGERVGEWELVRERSKVVARGEYPRGTPVPWTATLGDQSVSFEIATAVELGRWVTLAEQWFSGLGISNFKGWPAEERPRASEWIEAQLALAPLSDEVDEAPAFEAAGRDILVHANGDISQLAHPAIDRDGDDDDDDMEAWIPPRTGTMVVVGTVELPRRMVVDSPEYPDQRRVFSFRPGTYELVGLDDGAYRS